jgi:predicted ATPase
METSAEPGTVLVSENTYRLIPSEFEWEPLGKVKVKGISAPLVVYRPLAPRADIERLQSYGLSVPLIGRDTEFNALKASVEDLYAGRGSIATVTGERGMGKSFLVAEVRHHFARQGALLAQAHDEAKPSHAPLTWLRGRARSYDQSRPYSMWLDLLNNWLGGQPDQPAEEIRDRLRYQAEKLWGDRMPRYYPYLTKLLSLPLEPEFTGRLQRLAAENLRQRFFDTMYAWVEALAQQGPLVLYFGDMHWADATSLELLKHCLPIVDNKAVLWLLVFRPDRALPVWKFRYHVDTEYPHRLTAISLSPLNEAESSEIIDHLIGPEVLTEEMQELVIEKAEGTPYYIQELIHALMSQGILVQENGVWQVRQKVTSIDLPDSLQNLLLARIDRLSTKERQLVQMASVIGTVFWSEVLAFLAEDPDAVKPHLTTLQRGQLIAERGQVPNLGMEYVFKSTLLRDAAYDGLLSEQRKALHLQVTQYFETHFDEEALVPYHGLLAYHYQQAGRLKKELTYTLRAAERARRVYANAEALDRYTHAVQLLDRMEAQDLDEKQQKSLLKKRFRVLDGRREVNFLLGNSESAWRDALALLPIARQLEDEPTWLIDALLQQPGVSGRSTQSEMRGGISMAEEALALAQQIGDEHREMLCLGTISGQRYNLGDPSWQELGDRALELARKLGDRRYEVALLTSLGRVYASRDPDRSLEYLQAALPICQVLNDKQAEIELLNLIGVQWESSDDYYRRLFECHEQQIKLSREISNRPAEAQALMFAGQLRGIYLGDFEKGLDMLQEALDITASQSLELYVRLRMAQIYVMQGRYAKAKQVLEYVKPLVPKVSHPIGKVGYRLVFAILCNALGDKSHLQQALAVTEEMPQLPEDNPQFAVHYQMAKLCERAAAYLGLSNCASDEDQRKEYLQQALQVSRAALDIYEETGYVRPVECSSEELLYRCGMILSTLGQTAEARDYFRRAYKEMMRKHDMIPPNTRFRRTYLENIKLHQEIRTTYVSDIMRVQWDGSKIKIRFDDTETF